MNPPPPLPPKALTHFATLHDILHTTVAASVSLAGMVARIVELYFVLNIAYNIFKELTHAVFRAVLHPVSGP